MGRSKCAAVALVFLTLNGPAVGQDGVDGSTGWRICGPRAAELVLHWYGRDEDVSALIEEMRGDREDGLVDLAGLAGALARRGVHIRAVRVSRAVELDWPYPVVLHALPPNQPGHYVVRVPPRPGYPALYWSGETGYTRELDERYRVGLTGVMLLTSPEPIAAGDPAAAVTGRWRMTAAGVGLAIGFGGLMAAVRAFSRRAGGRGAASPGGGS